MKSGEDASGSTVLFVRKPKRPRASTTPDAVAVAANAEDAAETDDAGERKRHACRACLRNGVVAEDHFKFGKKCPFHPQYAKPEAVSRVPRENEEKEKDTKEELPAKREAREDVADAVASERASSAAPENRDASEDRVFRDGRAADRYGPAGVRVPNRGGRGLERRGRRSGTHRGGEHSRRSVAALRAPSFFLSVKN